MADIKSIFNHKRTNEKSKDEEHLYDWRRPAYKKDDVGNLNRLLKNLGRTKSATWRTSAKDGASGRSSHIKSEGSENSRRQRVTVKMSVGHSAQAHAKYLHTYMPQTEKAEVSEKPELFGTDLDEYTRHLEKDHFKFIISPENQNVDVRLLARKFVERLENLTGFKLYWEACVHENTAHRHAHLAINGTDRDGRKVYFAKELVRTMMREVLCSMATAMVGERTLEEIKAANAMLPTAARWTNLDERLCQLPKIILASNLDMSLQNRLAYLATIKLAVKNGTAYSLSPEWQSVLKTGGRYNSFLEEFLKDDSLPLKLYEGGFLKGKVERSISFDKDESWNDAVVVRTSSARFYVPVYQLHKEDLEGKSVQLNATGSGLGRQVSDRDIKVVNDMSYNIER